MCNYFHWTQPQIWLTSRPSVHFSFWAQGKFVFNPVLNFLRSNFLILSHEHFQLQDFTTSFLGMAASYRLGPVMLSTSDGAPLNASLTSHQLFSVVKIQLISFLFSSSQAGMPTSGASDTGHRSAEGCWGTIHDFFLVFFTPTMAIASPRQGTWLTRLDPWPQIKSTLCCDPD